MNNKVNSVLNSIEKIDHLVMEADVSVSDAMNDVYNKQFKMEGNATEDYINHEYYQESVIAGILIGGGIIAVLATAIVLITKHVKKSASGDPEKKDDKSTAAGTALDNPNEVKKKVEQIKSELTKVGGSVEIKANGIDTDKLKQKFDLVEKLCDSAEGFLKETEDGAIQAEMDNFTKLLEEINNVKYESSGNISISADSLDGIVGLAAPIATMTAKLNKTAEELTKRAKENKNKGESETDFDKKEQYERLKEGLEKINKGSTELSKSLDVDLKAIRTYLDEISKAATEKNKSSEAENRPESENPVNPNPAEEAVKKKISDFVNSWSSSNGNKDAATSISISPEEANTILNNIWEPISNDRSPEAIKVITRYLDDHNDQAHNKLIKSLIEEADRRLFDDMADEVKQQVLEAINNHPSGEQTSQEDDKKIASFIHDFINRGKNKKGTATMSENEIKKILNELYSFSKSDPFGDIENKMLELFNKQANYDLKSIFTDLMIEAKDPIFGGKAPSENMISTFTNVIAGKTIETKDLKYNQYNPEMDSIDGSGKGSPDPSNGGPTSKDNNLMDSLSTITKNPAEILNEVIQSNPAYKSYENDQDMINTVIPKLSELTYDKLVQTVQSVNFDPKEDPIKLALFRDIAKEIAKEQGWTDKIDDIKLSDETEKKVNQYIRSHKVQLTDDDLNDIATTIHENRVNEGKQTIGNDIDYIKNMINTMKNRGINAALNANYINLKNQIQSNPQLTDTAKHMAELIHDTAIYYGNITGEPESSIEPIPPELVINIPSNIETKETKPEQPHQPEKQTPQTNTLRWLFEDPDAAINYANNDLRPDGRAEIPNSMIRNLKMLIGYNMIDVLSKYYDDSGSSIDFNTEMNWSDVVQICYDVDDLVSVYESRNDINEFLNRQYSDKSNNDYFKNKYFQMAKAYVELQGGPNELLKPDGTKVSVNSTKSEADTKKDEPEHTNTDRQTSDAGYMLNTNPAFFAEISNLKNMDDFNKITVSEEVFKKRINELIETLGYKTNTQFDDKDRVDGFIGEIKTVLSALSNHTSLLKSCSSESMKFLDLMEDFITGITVPADDTEANDNLNDIRNMINNVKNTIGVEQQTDGTNPAAENNITPEQDQDEKFEELRQKITAELKNKYPSGCNVISLYGSDIADIVTVILGMCMSNKSNQEIQNTVNEMIFGFIKSTTTLASNNIRYVILNKKFKDQPAEYQNAINALINAVNISIDEANKITGNSYTIDTKKYTYDLTGKFYNKTILSHADLKEVMTNIENKFGQTQQQSQTSNDTQSENTNQNTDSDTSNLSGLARLKDHNQVPDIVKEVNQLDEPGVNAISDKEIQELKTAAEEKLMPFIEKGMEIYYNNGNSYKLDSIPLSRKNVRMILSFAKIINQIYDANTDLDGLLMQKYSKDIDQKLKDFYYQMAKLYAQEMNIHVTLTDPNGKKEEINANPVFN